MGHLHSLLDKMGLDKMDWCKLINALDRMGPFHFFFLDEMGLDKVGRPPLNAIMQSKYAMK